MDVEAAFQPSGPGVDQARLWYGVQNLIIGAGNISKTLLAEQGQSRGPTRASTASPGEPGRPDHSVLRRIKIRNDFEHLDERIETWWEESTNHNFVEGLIGPRGSIGGDAIDEQRDILRWFDPTTAT